MNWLKENPFLSGVIAVAAVGLLGLGLLVNGAMSNSAAVSDAYLQAVQKLQTLQNRSPFPDEANLAKATELRDAYRNRLDALKKQLGALQIPVNPNVTPQQFQDDLRVAVNEIVSRAEAAKVKLPDNFYLGFDSYRDSLPQPAAAPVLARQLDFISGVVGGLIGTNVENPGVRSIDSLDRPRLPEENPQAATPAAAPTPGRPAKPGTPAPAAGPLKIPFSLGFTAEQGKLRIAFNNLLNSESFVIVRSLTIHNSNLEGPLVATEQLNGASTAAGAADIFNLSSLSPDSTDKASLNVILGREVVKVNALIEMVDFQFPAGEPTKQK
ncbi:MAG: hypothetical protein Fur0032_10460 [Terrimicrobiaceae bacterium]